MWAVTRSIKFQNKLAKEAIINALKSRSKEMFQDGDDDDDDDVDNIKIR